MQADWEITKKRRRKRKKIGEKEVYKRAHWVQRIGRRALKLKRR